jgi:hypothetical protein
MGGMWAQTAAAQHVYEAEIVDDERIAVPAGTPALLTQDEADDLIEILDAVAAAAPLGPGRSRAEELALLLRQRLHKSAT